MQFRHKNFLVTIDGDLTITKIGGAPKTIVKKLSPEMTYSEVMTSINKLISLDDDVFMMVSESQKND